MHIAIPKIGRASLNRAERCARLARRRSGWSLTVIVAVAAATAACGDSSVDVEADGSESLTVHVSYVLAPQRGGGPAKWYEVAFLDGHPETVDAPLTNARMHTFVEATSRTIELDGVEPGRTMLLVRGITADCDMPWYGAREIDLPPGAGPWTVQVELGVLIAGYCPGACMSSWCLEESDPTGRCRPIEGEPACP